MKREKPIYRTFSSFRFLKISLIKIVFVFVLFLVWDHLRRDFDWNIAGIGLVGLLLLALDQKELIVYSDRLRVRQNIFFGIFGLNRDFLYADIEKVEMTGSLTKKADLIEDLISLVVSPPIGDTINEITIQTKEGKRSTYKTRVYKEKIQQGFEILREKEIETVIDI